MPIVALPCASAGCPRQAAWQVKPADADRLVFCPRCVSAAVRTACDRYGAEQVRVRPLLTGKGWLRHDRRDGTAG
jgi:hypothetical protein